MREKIVNSIIQQDGILGHTNSKINVLIQIIILEMLRHLKYVLRFFHTSKYKGIFLMGW